MVKHPQQEALASLIALMRTEKVLQAKVGDMEVVLHPEAFVLAQPASAEAPRPQDAKSAPESIAERDPTLFAHLR